MAPEQARWWSWRRQRLDRTSRGVEDALKSVIAITSANPSAPLALLARVPRMLQGMYDGAVKARVAVRLPAMRRAVWLTAADTAHIPFHACRGTGITERNLLRRSGVGPDRWNELREQILKLCEKPLDAREVKAAIREDPEKLSAVLTVLATTGEILRVRAPSLHSNSFAFAATEAWLGRPLAPMPRDDALTFLAGDYLQAYGPATVEDFVWWTGLPRQRCEPALMQHDPMRLEDGHLLWPAHARAFEQSRPVANRVNLLPAWDAYPMGYADRSRLGRPDAVAAAFDRTGNSLPIVLVEGRIAGLWDFRLSRADVITIDVNMFEGAGGRLWEDIEAEAGAIAALFQARSLRITRAERRLATTETGRAPAAPTAVPMRAAPRRVSTKRAGTKRAGTKRTGAKRAGTKRTATKRTSTTRARRAAPKRAASAGRKRTAAKRAPAKVRTRGNGRVPAKTTAGAKRRAKAAKRSRR